MMFILVLADDDQLRSEYDRSDLIRVLPRSSKFGSGSVDPCQHQFWFTRVWCHLVNLRSSLVKLVEHER
ncbi:hypothetical protein Hanom_Chr09g00792181 [Helianthus anomalus]